MEFKKNKWRLLALFLLSICIYSAWVVYGSSEANLTNQDFIRFHVIANSDTQEDQALKKVVRDGLLEKINDELVIQAVALADEKDRQAGLDLAQSREYIRSNLVEIEGAAEEIVKAQGYDYEVTAELGARFVPEKVYGNVIFPAGNYEALNVTIGTGEGQNWWCVLFPPLCLIGAEAPEDMSAEALCEEALAMEALGVELFLDPRYAELLEAASREKQTALKLEFKTLNYMKRID